MKLKANLHFHTDDDPCDSHIKYNFYEGIDAAAKLGFEVIALTCHQKLVYPDAYQVYAEKNGILLIPGVERNIEKRHVVILNPTPEIERVSNFPALKEYKKNHPECLILAPHPYFYGFFSLKNKLEENIELFDAVEFSWFYSKWFNRNKKGEVVAKKHNLPWLATSDTHFLETLDKSYAVLEVKEKTVAAVLEAVRNKKFTNISSPRKFFREMVWSIIKIFL